MKRAIFAAAVTLLLCGACGKTPQVTAVTAVTTAATTAVPQATGAPPIRLLYEGGMVPAGAAFANTPLLVVAGDGTTYTPAAVTMQYPGKLVNPVLIGKLDAPSVNRLIDGARKANLLRDVKYTPNNHVADAPDTVLELTVDGHTYVHRANALGLGGGPNDADRNALAAYVRSLETLDVGQPTPRLPTQLAIRAVASNGSGEPPANAAPLAWPDTAGVRLADAKLCKLVATDMVRATVEAASQISHFTDHGVEYSVYARPFLPGDQC